MKNYIKLSDSPYNLCYQERYSNYRNYVYINNLKKKYKTNYCGNLNLICFLKKCGCCKMLQPINYFSAHKNRSDGLRPDCTACSTERGKQGTPSRNGFGKKISDIEAYYILKFEQDYKCPITGICLKNKTYHKDHFFSRKTGNNFSFVNTTILSSKGNIGNKRDKSPKNVYTKEQYERIIKNTYRRYFFKKYRKKEFKKILKELKQEFEERKINMRELRKPAAKKITKPHYY